MRKIFVAYARQDRRWFKEDPNCYPLIPRIRDILRAEGVEVWWDETIPPASPWREEIERHVQDADIAILLVSSHFLASEYVRTTELPMIERRVKARKMKALAVIVGHCDWQQVSIVGDYQLARGDSTPLINSINNPAALDEAQHKIIEDIKKILREIESQTAPETTGQEKQKSQSNETGVSVGPRRPEPVQRRKAPWWVFMLVGLGVVGLVLLLRLLITSLQRHPTLQLPPPIEQPADIVTRLARLNISLSEGDTAGVRQRLEIDTIWSGLAQLCLTTLGSRMVIDPVPFDAVVSHYNGIAEVRTDKRPVRFDQPEFLKQAVFDAWKERHSESQRTGFEQVVTDTAPAGSLPTFMVGVRDGDRVGFANVLNLAYQPIGYALPAGHAAWIVVFAHRFPRFHPQTEPARKVATGRWVVTAYVGKSPEEDIGGKFDLLLVLADSSASSQFRSYLDKAAQKQNWPGLDRLPDGAHIVQTVTVFRK